MDRKQIKFGHRVKDLVSGFVGIVTADVHYMNGCEKWAIDGKVTGATLEGIWVDKSQVEFIDDGIRPTLFPNEYAPEVKGGPTIPNPIIEKRPGFF